jgi:hypothetical protein
MKNVFIRMSDASNFTYDIFTSWIFFAQPKLVKLQSKEYRRPKCFRKFLTQKIIIPRRKPIKEGFIPLLFSNGWTGGGGGGGG